MNEAKPGARLAGRYRLTERLALSPDESTWHAVDSTLDRQVTVWILRPGHPFADDVLDTARRVALIDDRRLIKVLDVGTDSGTQGDRAYVVNEFVEGETLESLSATKPLSDAAARRVAGETAEGLTAAATRGLHHLKLTPRLITVTPKGVVKIGGLAVLAAAAGLDPGHATRANRSDATAIIGLLYYALTGRWPGGDAGFPAAPRTAAGHPVPPGELVPGVPADLDELCTRVLGSAGEGPSKPADIALDLTPWSSAAQADLMPAAKSTPTRPEPVQPQPTSAAAPPAESPSAPLVAASGHQPPARPAPDRTGDSRFRPSPPAMPPPMPSPGSPRGTTGQPLRPGLGPTPHPPAAPAVEPPPAPPAGPAPRPVSPAARTAAAPAVPAPDPAPPAPDAPAGPAARTADGRPTPAKRPATALRRPTDTQPINAPNGRTNGTGTNGTGNGRANGSSNARISNRPKGTSLTGSGPKTGPNGLRINGRVNGNNAVPSTGEELLPWASTWSPSTQAPSALESTGPFPLVLPQEAPPAKQSRQVLLAVVGVLAVLAVLAAFSLRGLLGGGDEISPGATAVTGPSLTEPSPAATGSTTPAASASAAAPVAPQIAAIRAIDPQGDGDENTSDSPKAVDGDTATSWTSQTYRSAAFGGLKKGVGLAIRLKQRTDVSTVTVQLKGTGGRLQLRLGPNSDPVQAVVADSQAITGDTITLTPKRATKARYVILWFTELPRTEAGYTAEVVEVRVT